MTTLTPEQLAELRIVAEAAYKAWQEGDKVFKHPETFSDTSRRAFMAGRASLFAALAEAQAERDRLKAKLEAMTEAMKQSLLTLDLAMDISLKYEPCGYYCSERAGHVDHKLFNWARESKGSIEAALASAEGAKDE